MDREIQLIQRAQGGDMASFNELVRLHDRSVLALAARYVNNSEDAKDIYQEVLIRVYRGLPRFRIDSRFSTWVHRITVNVCIGHRRKLTSARHVPLDGAGNGGHPAHHAEPRSPEAGPDVAAMNADTADHVHRALQTLSPRQRMVFMLRHYEGHSLKEISSALRCSEGTVKRYLFTATRRLRLQLEGLF